MRLLNTWCLIMTLLTLHSPGKAVAVDSARIDYQWNTSINFPQFGNENIDGQIKEWLIDIVLPTTEYPKAITSLDLEKNGWNMEINHTLSYPSRDAVTVEFMIFTYPHGAAHPLTGIQTLSFLTDSGKQLGLEDLFENPQKALEIFAANAKQLIQDELIEKFPENFHAGFEDMLWFDDGFDADPQNYSALILKPEGVRVCFQQYQILPYVFGISKPLFTLELLEPAGPNRKIWPAR